MADTFDFDAFISSPSQADVVAPPPVAPTNTTAANPPPIFSRSMAQPRTPSLLGAPSNDMASSFSDTRPERWHRHDARSSSLMGPSDSMMYATDYSESFGNDLMDAWDMNDPANAANPSSAFDFGSVNAPDSVAPSGDAALNGLNASPFVPRARNGQPPCPWHPLLRLPVPLPPMPPRRPATLPRRTATRSPLTTRSS